MKKLVLTAAAIVLSAGVSGAAFASDVGHDAAAAVTEAAAVDTTKVEEAVKAAGYASWDSVTMDTEHSKWAVVNAVKADGTKVYLDVDAATLAVTEAAAH